MVYFCKNTWMCVRLFIRASTPRHCYLHTTSKHLKLVWQILTTSTMVNTILWFNFRSAASPQTIIQLCVSNFHLFIITKNHLRLKLLNFLHQLSKCQGSTWFCAKSAGLAGFNYPLSDSGGWAQQWGKKGKLRNKKMLGFSSLYKQVAAAGGEDYIPSWTHCSSWGCFTCAAETPAEGLSLI